MVILSRRTFSGLTGMEEPELGEIEKFPRKNIVYSYIVLQYSIAIE